MLCCYCSVCSLRSLSFVALPAGAFSLHPRDTAGAPSCCGVVLLRIVVRWLVFPVAVLLLRGAHVLRRVEQCTTAAAVMPLLPSPLLSPVAVACADAGTRPDVLPARCLLDADWSVSTQSAVCVESSCSIHETFAAATRGRWDRSRRASAALCSTVSPVLCDLRSTPAPPKTTSGLGLFSHPTPHLSSGTEACTYIYFFCFLSPWFFC